MKQPVVSGRETIRILLKAGFSVVRQRGSHVHLVKEGSKRLHVTVPVHGNKDLNPFVFRSIARQAGYTPEEFAKLFGE
jgi:predicted RNA binding protein YcfA (HicA-like mRNA interferase family)